MIHSGSIMVAPALLVIARPVTLLLHSAGNPVHTWVRRALRSPVVTALTWPPAATTLYCAVVVGTHLLLVPGHALLAVAAREQAGQNVVRVRLSTQPLSPAGSWPGAYLSGIEPKPGT